MATQISFYLSEADFTALSDYAKKKNFAFLSAVFTEKTPTELKDLCGRDSEKNPKKILVLASQTDLLHINYHEKFKIYSIDELTSPCIEFLPSGEESGAFYSGRLFYEKEYWENGILIEKNEAFLQAAKDLFRWFRKTFKKVNEPPFSGFYASQSLVRYAQEGGKIAVN